MARSALTDYLQNYPFWLMDIAPIEPLAMPLFTPLLGFSSITAPEITVEIDEISEANWFFRSKVVKGGDAGSITLLRASKWYDDDFYRWMLAALSGDTGGRGARNAAALGGPTPRRDLLLVHFLAHSPLPPGASQAAAATGILALQGTATALTGGTATLNSAAFGANVPAIGGSAIASAAGQNLGPFEYTPRMPAKAWVLYGCLPSRYKAAGDFDATDSSISIQELEVAVEYWDELSLGSEAAPVAYGVAVANAIGAATAR